MSNILDLYSLIYKCMFLDNLMTDSVKYRTTKQLELIKKYGIKNQPI